MRSSGGNGDVHVPWSGTSESGIGCDFTSSAVPDELRQSLGAFDLTRQAVESGRNRSANSLGSIADLACPLGGRQISASTRNVAISKRPRLAEYQPASINPRDETLS